MHSIQKPQGSAQLSNRSHQGACAPRGGSLHPCFLQQSVCPSENVLQHPNSITPLGSHLRGCVVFGMVWLPWLVPFPII